MWLRQIDHLVQHDLVDNGSGRKSNNTSTRRGTTVELWGAEVEIPGIHVGSQA